MATPGQWWQGARPRTLPAAVAPVLVGTAIAWWELSASSGLVTGGAYGWIGNQPTTEPTPIAVSLFDGPSLLPSWMHLPASPAEFVLRALLALVVALALQVGVNYANDYSDGVRGTDDARVGPVRLVGQGLASPSAVKRAAFLCFGVAALAGLALVVITQAWWLLLVGAAAIVAAWFYTGGPRPYGYAGLGEVFVFVFFGLVTVMGSTYVQTLTLSWLSFAGGVACGALSVAILLANNLRDIPTDRVAGKMTLAVRLGDPGTRTAYVVAAAVPFAVALLLAVLVTPWALLALVAAAAAVRPVRVVRGGAVGRDLVPVLAGTGRLLLAYAVLLSAGLALATTVA